MRAVFQWAVFVPSAFFQTAAYFDVAGPAGHFVLGFYRCGGCFQLRCVIPCFMGSLTSHGTYHTRQTLVSVCVLVSSSLIPAGSDSDLLQVWAARLATFLYARIQRAGGDSRFDAIKQHGPRFFNMWTIQVMLQE